MLVWFSAVASPQNTRLSGDDKEEAQRRAELFRERAFSKYGESYYSGPFQVDNLTGLACSLAGGQAARSCQMVIGLDNPLPAPISAVFDGSSNEGGYQWVVFFNASNIRSRYRADGVWQPWGS
jgi:hypothetical protein